MAGVHKRFKKNKDVILKTLKDLENDHDPTWFCFVKLINCNATNGEKFSNAWCHTDRNIYADEEDLRSIVPFSHLFNFDIARSFMENEHRPEGSVLEAQLVAFERLSSFLENIEEISKLLQRVKENQNDVSESSLAAVLGIHVLKKLSVSQQMIFDTGYRDIKPQQCPCGKCDESILSGDNSIGHSDVWHGSVDIILRDTACSIKKLNDIDPPDSEIEMKRHYDFELFRSQFIAETITFAFLIKARLTPFLCLSCNK